LAKLQEKANNGKCAAGNEAYCHGNPATIAAFSINSLVFPGPTMLQIALTGIFGSPKSPSEQMAEAAITVTPKGLSHVFDNHTIGGVESQGQSVFFNKKEIPGLIKQAESVAPELQEETGNLERVVEAETEIGIDMETKLPTMWYTVITDVEDTLITAFPGFPLY
jgi:hypothetical protein